MSAISSTNLVAVKQTRRIMATTISVHLAIRPEQRKQAHAAIARCMAWLERVGERLTRFSAQSELARLNATNATNAWQPVSKLLFNVVAESLAAAHASNGLFDPALLPLLEALGYDRDFRSIARHDGAAMVRTELPQFTAGRWRDIELDPARRRIRMPPGARLDLGGIAKGWAIDVALERFFDAFPHVLLDAGGDLRARGGPEVGNCWALGIGDARAQTADTTPCISQPPVVLALGKGGLATSGATTRWWYQGDERRHHILDPRTSMPVRLWIEAGDDQISNGPLIATASALAPTAAHAEVAAKVALLRGYPAALDVVEAAWQARIAGEREGQQGDPYAAYGDEHVALIVMLGSGVVVCSANVQEYLATSGGGGEIWLD